VNAAQLIQHERDMEDLRNHKERITWLSAERPLWACGALVDANTKNALLTQSRAVVSRIGAALNDKGTKP
jgi:uncharacterized protein YciI